MTQGVFLKTKPSEWSVIRAGRLIEPGPISKELKKKTTKTVIQVNFLQEPQNSIQN